MIYIKKQIGFILICSLTYIIGYSQELEPRAINNLPVGTNFAIAAYSYAQGNLLLDPALPIEDLNSNIHSGLLAYVRSIRFFDLSAKVDVVIPFILDDWEISEFQNYKPKNVSGLSVQIIVPTGNYDPGELINVGSNRWAIKPQWGFARNFNKWIVESYVSMWLFTNNTNFLNGNELSQKPLYTFKVHVIKELPKKMWIAFNTGYAKGGKIELNNTPRDLDNEIRSNLCFTPCKKAYTQVCL